MLCSKSPYWKLSKFIIPLAFTQIALDIGEQALNRSLTSSTNAVVELAAFGIAFKILRLCCGAIEDFKFVSMVMLKSKYDRRRIIIYGSIVSLVGTVLLLIVGLTPVGHLIINDFHDVSDEVGNKATKLLCMMCVYPFIDGLAWIHTGLLIQYKYSLTCGAAAVFDVVGQVITVVILLQTNLKTSNVILIPMVAAYVGLLVRLAFLLFSYYKHIAHRLPINDTERVTEEGEKEISFWRVIKFWAPLMAIRLVQAVSRPLINLFVTRDRRDGLTQKDGESGLAALTIIWPLARLPVGWLNELRALEPTFTKKNIDGHQEITVRQVRIFGIGAYITSQILMFLLFWIPDITLPILTDILNVDYSLAMLCITPLKILSFLPIPVVHRAMATSWLLKIKKTVFLYPSAFIRLATVVILLIVLPRYGVHGATLGGGALFAGFVVDGLSVVVAAMFVRWRRRRGQRDNQEEGNNKILTVLEEEEEETKFVNDDNNDNNDNDNDDDEDEKRL